MKFGVTRISHPPGLISAMYDNNELHVSPNGALFCKSSVRQGIVPRMLDEILQIPVMVKNIMKDAHEGSAWHRLLNARQVRKRHDYLVSYLSNKDWRFGISTIRPSSLQVLLGF